MKIEKCGVYDMVGGEEGVGFHGEPRRRRLVTCIFGDDRREDEFGSLI